MTEDLFPLTAVGTHVVAHVLDDPEDRYIDLAEHGNAALHIQQRHVLRSADDHPAAERDLLSKGESGISGTRRQVDDEVVQFTPQHISEKLPDDAHHDRPAPDDRRLVVEKEPHRDEADAVFFYRVDFLVLAGTGCSLGSHHQGHAGTVDVGVKQSHAIAQGFQRQCQIHRYGRFPHPSLATGDSDHSPYARKRSQGRRSHRGWLRRSAARIAAVNRHLLYTRYGRQGGSDPASQVTQHFFRSAGRTEVNDYRAVFGEDLSN